MMEIIQVFQSTGWDIIFATPAADSPHRINLQVMGIAEQLIELNSDSFDKWLATVAPQAVLFDRFMMEEQFGWRVARTCPHAMRILDTEDLHFLRQAREQACRKNIEMTDAELHNETALREIASIYRSDISLIISDRERRLLTEQFQLPDALLHYFPFLVEKQQVKLLGYDERRGFLFIGTVRHAPNLDAIRYLKTVLWPGIRRQLPGAELNVIGSYPTREVIQMHQPKAGFNVLGHVEDIKPYLETSRVFLAPMRFGAGLKGKLIEAMQWGIPSITTPTGAEGIGSHENWPGAVTRNDQQYINEAVSYYESETKWARAQQNGLELIKNNFDLQYHSRKLSERVEQIRDRLQAHRQKNFFGQMLLHHSMRSTEFMSRWIDCKNRKAR
jgi:glycosyltransferase involved in cell wall biosynthesis